MSSEPSEKSILWSTTPEAGLIEKLIYGPDCLYREGRAGFFKYFSFDRWYAAKTPWGFDVHYRLKGTVQRVNNETFREGRMLEPGKIDAVADRWNVEVFPRAVGPTFISLGFANEQLPDGIYPKAWLFRTELREGRQQLVPDHNVSYARQAIRSFLHKSNWEWNGCKVVHVDLYAAVSDLSIHRNYAMLKPEQIAAAESDKRMQRATEVAAVAALERWMLMNEELQKAERNQDVGNKFLTVKTWGLDNKQFFRWTKKEQRSKEDWEVLGFREENGFCEDPYSEAASATRIRVVHSNLEADKTVNSLQPGRTYYFSFFLKNARTQVKDAFLRMSVRIPTLDEQRKEFLELQRTIAWLKSRVEQPPSKSEDDGVFIDFAELRKHAETQEKLEEFLQEWAKKWKQGGIDEEGIEDRLGPLRSMARTMMEQKNRGTK